MVRRIDDGSTEPLARIFPLTGTGCKGEPIRLQTGAIVERIDDNDEEVRIFGGTDLLVEAVIGASA